MNQSHPANLGQLVPPASEPLRDVVVTWNQKHADHPRDRTLVQLFESIVDAAPHAILGAVQRARHRVHRRGRARPA